MKMNPKNKSGLKRALGVGALAIVTGSSLFAIRSGLQGPIWPKIDPTSGQFLEFDDSAYINPNQVEQNVIPFYTLPTSESPFKLGSVIGENGEEVTYTIAPDKLGSYGLSQSVSEFGEFTVLGPNSMELFKIRHGQYVVGQNGDTPELGIRVIPVEDDGTAQGNKIMDTYLRYKMGLSPEDKIFAPIAYFHPEYTKSTLDGFSDNHRLDDGFTHMGAYIGEGKTRNAPYNYHSKKWGMGGGYPAHVISVKYAGAKDAEGNISQQVFNTNAYIALKLLNETGSNVRFSRLDYERDYFDANNLKSLMDHYRGWLDPEWIRSDKDKEANGDPKPFNKIISENLKYDTYCAEHITMAINIALNLAQTKEGYIELFGKDEDQDKLGAAKQFNGVNKGGEYFFKLAQKKWQEEINEPWPTLKGTLTPLWKMAQKDGSPLLHPKAIDSIGVAAGDKIEEGQASLISEVGFSLGWAPQTLPDLVSDMIALYGRVDSYANALNIPGQEQPLTAYDVPAEVAAALAQFGVEKVKPGTAHPMKLLLGLYKAVSDRVKFTETPENQQAEMMGYIKLVAPILVKMAKFGEQMKQGAVEANAEIYNAYVQAVKPDLEKLRSEKVYNLEVADNDFFYYTPPTVINRMVQGNHRHNRYVQFETIGTAIDSYQTKVVEDNSIAALSSNYILNTFGTDSAPSPVVVDPVDVEEPVDTESVDADDVETGAGNIEQAANAASEQKRRQ